MKIINYSNLRDNMKMYMHYAKEEEIIITRKDGNVVMISEEKYNEMKLLKGTNNSYVSETPMEYASIQSNVYKQAQDILTELGTSVDAAFNMFLKQVVLTKGIPFEVKLPEKITSISEEDIISRVHEGIDDIENGRVKDAKEYMESFRKDKKWIIK